MNGSPTRAHKKERRAISAIATRHIVCSRRKPSQFVSNWWKKSLHDQSTAGRARRINVQSWWKALVGSPSSLGYYDGDRRKSFHKQKLVRRHFALQSIPKRAARCTIGSNVSFFISFSDWAASKVWGEESHRARHARVFRPCNIPKRSVSWLTANQDLRANYSFAINWLKWAN